jgi:hypothetical protein
VPVGQGCREVKGDGTAGLVGCWIKRRRRRHRTAGEFGRMPRSRLTKATAGMPAFCWHVSDQRHNLPVFCDTNVPHHGRDQAVCHA